MDQQPLYKQILVKQVKKYPKVKIIKNSCQTPKTNLNYWKSSPNTWHKKKHGKIQLVIQLQLSRKNTALIPQSQQQSFFTSNQEEAGSRIALHCPESSKLVLIKAKDTDILILMVHAFALTSPSYE